MDREAIEEAIEVLEDASAEMLTETGNKNYYGEAIAVLRQALAQPEHEPVYAFRRKGLDDFCTCDKRRYDELAGKPNLFEVTVFYTAPPKKQWVGLTDDDVIYFRSQATFCDEFDAAFMAELIEKDLKEKNHG